MATPIYNPVIPCLYPLPGGMYPGRMIRVQGNVPPGAQRFAINLQCGPNTDPRDDIALHLNFRFVEMCVVRNHLTSMDWGMEETDGGIPIRRGEAFEALLLCEPQSIKVALNGVHFCEFLHRTPYQRITHITVDGDVHVQFIGFEGAAPVQQPYMAEPPSYGGSFGPPPPAYGAPAYGGAPQVHGIPPPTAVQGYSSPQYGAPQQRSGMGTGAAVGLGVGALAAGGLAGYAMGGGFRSDSPPAEVGYPGTPQYGGSDPLFGSQPETPHGGNESFQIPPGYSEVPQPGTPGSDVAESTPLAPYPEGLSIADLTIHENQEATEAGNEGIEVAEGDDYLEVNNEGDGDDDYLENDNDGGNDDGGNDDFANDNDDYLEDNDD